MAIVGSVFGWLVLSLITKNFDSESLILILVGVLLGYQIGKKEKATTNENEFTALKSLLI